MILLRLFLPAWVPEITFTHSFYKYVLWTCFVLYVDQKPKIKCSHYIHSVYRQTQHEKKKKIQLLSRDTDILSFLV